MSPRVEVWSRPRRPDTLGRWAVIVLSGLLTGVVLGLAVLGVASLVAEPAVCVNLTWA